MGQKAFLIIITCVFVLVGKSVVCAQTEEEREIIAYGKQIDVSKIDSRLPSQKFSDWVKTLAGEKAKTKWEVNDCGEQTGAEADMDRDLPICVGVESKMDDGRTIQIAVSIGTNRKGLADTFGVYICIVLKGDRIFSVNELSKLQKLLEDTR